MPIIISMLCCWKAEPERKYNLPKNTGLPRGCKLVSRWESRDDAQQPHGCEDLARWRRAGKKGEGISCTKAWGYLETASYRWETTLRKHESPGGGLGLAILPPSLISFSSSLLPIAPREYLLVSKWRWERQRISSFLVAFTQATLLRTGMFFLLLHGSS